MSSSTTISSLLNLKTNHEDASKIIENLTEAIQNCKLRFKKTELASDDNNSVKRLCHLWEKALSHGLKSPTFILKNVTDFVSGVHSDSPTFFAFAYSHLTHHEKERFSSLRQVWTDSGKGRSLIRAALNEHSLERYILTWVNDKSIEAYYESYAILRNEKFISILAQSAADLTNILFAINVDSSELNIASKLEDEKIEPVIESHAPVKLVKKVGAIRRVIIDGDDEESISVGSDYGASPKPLSSFCLKHDENKHHLVASSPIIERIPLVSERQIDPGSKRDSLDSVEKIYENFDTNSNVENIFEIEITSPESGDVEVSNDDISSMPSSINSNSNVSLTSMNDVNVLREKLRTQETKCHELEEKVNELTIENHRLRITAVQQRTITFFTISISRAIIKKTSTSCYYAYEIHIIPTQSGDEWSVLKRYREFYQLHKQLTKQNHFIKSLDFPPKKKLGNMDVEFVEQRRQRLQVYLKHLLTLLPQLSICNTRSQLEQAFPFFKN